ncbi:HNH endonuclease signature motif containing protein, partial [Mycobacterium kiyosense]
PLLSAAERQYLTCDATWEAWFQRDGQLIGTGRETRQISRRLRRALEHRDRCCVVPGCGATRGLHAHHLQHWEDGGPTELHNLALVCPYHHRAHHRGLITLTGPADQLTVTDSNGR